MRSVVRWRTSSPTRLITPIIRSAGGYGAGVDFSEIKEGISSSTATRSAHLTQPSRPLLGYRVEVDDKDFCTVYDMTLPEHLCPDGNLESEEARGAATVDE